MRFGTLALSLLIIGVLFLHFPLVHADQGGFSPVSLGISIFESKQNAIIAWSGTEEILILSTDLSSSNETEVLEIMPLPSDPAISKGEIQSFVKVQDLINTYFSVTTAMPPINYFPESPGPTQSRPNVTITFQEIIGVHFITVVNSNETTELIDWLEDFLETEGYSKALPSNLENLISHYLQNDINFFVINMIRTNETSRTAEPLIFRFESSKLYYPMRISSLFSGDSVVSLFTLTNSPLNDYSLIGMGFTKRAQFQIKRETVGEISANITQLFSVNPYLCYFSYSGSLRTIGLDISLSSQSGIDLGNIEASNVFPLTYAVLSLVLGLLLLFFLAHRIGRLVRRTQIPAMRWFESATAFTGLVGILLVLVGSFLPWGAVGYGRNGEVLLPLSALQGIFVPAIGIVNLFIFIAFLVAPLFAYYLLVEKTSKGAYSVLTVGGACMMFFMMASSAYYLSVVNVGVMIITGGCSLIVLAGLLSFLCARSITKGTSSTDKAENPDWSL